jgi:hypothetical protein
MLSDEDMQGNHNEMQIAVSYETEEWMMAFYRIIFALSYGFGVLCFMTSEELASMAFARPV